MSRRRHTLLYPIVPISALLTLLCFPRFTFAQGLSSLPRTHLSVQVNRALRDSLIHLPDEFIASGTDTLILDSGWILRRGKDYSIVYRFGTLRLDSLLLDSLIREPAHKLEIGYEYFPLHFPPYYARRTLIALRDSTGRDSLRISRPSGGFSIDDIFGANLQKSGSIVRGFTVGSNRDLSLNSGFRMQLSGKISSDIDVAASLTDENTPIQPEGTTQTLQEFDKVFVEIRSSDVAATLGDFDLDITGQEFSSLSRKLQGAKGTADYRLGETGGSVLISGAVTRGKFQTMQFNGLEAVQGPYRLTGRNGEPDIIVIAGTERVYINGERQTRGETNDYTIDYSTGEVTFMPRRLITSASRITVDFEYTDRQFSRSLIAAQSASRFFNDKARFTFTFIREADNPDAPIDFTITDSARATLEQAGGNRSKAFQSGVTAVDSGGVYAAVDTVLSGGVPFRYYRFAPGDPSAKYLVTFSFAGTGQGDYVRQQIGVFIFNGRGGGNYLPVIYLPVPQAQQVMDFSLEVHPVKALSVSGEYARSEFNANMLSDLPGVKSPGEAMKYALSYSPRNVTVGGTDIGGFDVQLKERRVGSLFSPIDRTNDIEFTRKWGVDTLASGNEEIQEGTLHYLPSTGVSLGGEYGKISRGDDQRAIRTEGDLSLQRADLPTTTYTIEHIRSTDQQLDEASSWLRQKGSLAYTFWNATPGFSYEGERREITSPDSGLFKAGSFSFDQFGPRLGVKSLGPVQVSAELLWRIDNLVNAGIITRESSSFTQTYNGRLAETASFTTSLDVTLREKRYSHEFRALGNTDIQTVLVRSQSRYAPLNRAVETDLYYEVSTERTSKLQQVFVQVPLGTGNYKYLGDLNHNGIADPEEFVQTLFDGNYVAITIPSDQMYPIVDLKTSARIRLTPSRLIGRGGTFLADAISAISTETYVRIEEKSTEQDLKNIYLLHLSRFLQDSTTLAGSQLFTQDLMFFDGRPMFSTRLRFSERRGLIDFAGGLERSFTRERSMRIRWQLIPEIANQLDYVNKIDRVTSQFASNRLHDVLSNSVTFDVSYRPEQNVEVGMKFDLGKATDRYQTPARGAALNAQALRMVYAFQGAGQLRAELTREEERVAQTLELLPYELTGGRVPGKTWLWRLGFDYRVTQFVQATVSYDGRSEGGAPPVHTARAEVRAFF